MMELTETIECLNCGRPQDFAKRKSQCESILSCGSDWVKALKILDHIEQERKEASQGSSGFDSNDVFLFSAALSCLSKAGEWERARDVLHGMERRGVTPDCVCYNAAMAACKFSGRFEQALDLLYSMMRRGVEPDVVTFNLGIFCAGRRHNLKAALHLMDTMLAKGLDPDRVSFATALGGCARAGRWDTAERLLHVMGARGVSLYEDAFFFAPMLSACEGSGDGAKALELLATMDRRGVPSDQLALKLVVGALAKQGAWERAVGVLEDMQTRRGLRPDAHSLRAVARACEQAGEREHAASLLASAQEAQADHEAAQRRAHKQKTETKKKKKLRPRTKKKKSALSLPQPDDTTRGARNFSTGRTVPTSIGFSSGEQQLHGTATRAELASCATPTASFEGFFGCVQLEE